jgi:cobalamin biosynthesis protein CobD/CbiB
VNKEIRKLALTTAVCILANLIIHAFFTGENLGWYIVAPVFLGLVNYLAFRIVKNTITNHPKRFVGMYMGSVFVRMLFSLFFIVIFLIISQKGKLPWVLAFILNYFIFTLFEIKIILANLRPENKELQDNDNDRK